MTLRFYFDTHIAKAVAVQLRVKGIDVIRCEEVGMANASDAAHLEYAASQGRVMVSHDQDFLRLAAQWQLQGKAYSGIFFIQQYLQGNVGQVVQRLSEYAELIEIGAGTIEDDITDRITYIG